MKTPGKMLDKCFILSAKRAMTAIQFFY